MTVVGKIKAIQSSLSIGILTEYGYSPDLRLDVKGEYGVKEIEVTDMNVFHEEQVKSATFSGYIELEIFEENLGHSETITLVPEDEIGEQEDETLEDLGTVEVSELSIQPYDEMKARELIQKIENEITDIEVLSVIAARSKFVSAQEAANKKLQTLI